MAYTSGFSYDESASSRDSRTFIFSETTSKGWLACPVAKNGPWQVFAFIKGANDTGCLDFQASGEKYEGGGVWQYN